MRQHLRLPALTLLLLATSACGGGSGFVPAPTGPDPAPVAPALEGGFHLSGIIQGPSPVFSADGVASATGTLTGDALFNNAGTVGSLPFDGGYTTYPDGTVTGGAVATGLGIGAVTPDRAFAALRVPSSPFVADGIEVFLQRDPTVNAGALVGTYRYVAILLDPPSPPDGARFLSSGGTLVFAGDGTAELIPEFLSVDGAHTPTEIEPALWALDVGGALELDFGSTFLVGGVARGGELISLAGGTTTGQQAMVLYAIRQGSGHTAASLTGPYMAAHHDADGATGLGWLGRLQADGLGRAQLQMIEGPGFLDGDDFAYALTPEGRLDVALLGVGGVAALPFQGAITQAGDAAVLVAGSIDGFPPSLLILVRPQDSAVATEIPPDVLQSGTLEEPALFLADPVQLLVHRGTFAVGEASTVIPLGGTPPPTARGALRFPLGGIPAGARIASASLVTEQTLVEGDPYVFPSALGDVSVDHVDFGRSLDAGDFNPARRPLGDLGVLADNALLGERSLDVTAAVRADVADGRATADFLLYFDIRRNDSDGELDRVVFDEAPGAGPSTGPKTRLVITYE